jgi:Zn-dependent protease with chaperone function
VIAHELGHLLLRDGAHSLVGLMQSDFNLLLAQQGRLWFTDDQARRIRTLLATENP